MTQPNTRIGAFLEQFSHAVTSRRRFRSGDFSRVLIVGILLAAVVIAARVALAAHFVGPSSTTMVPGWNSVGIVLECVVLVALLCILQFHDGRITLAASLGAWVLVLVILGVLLVTGTRTRFAVAQAIVLAAGTLAASVTLYMLRRDR